MGQSPLAPVDHLLLACVRLRASMTLMMYFKGTEPCELRSALLAFERLFSSVRPQVFAPMTFVRERTRALLALV